MIKRRAFFAALLAVLVVPLCYGQKALKPDHIGGYTGIYVEGTIQLSEGDQTGMCKNSWWSSTPRKWLKLKKKIESLHDKDGWPRRPVSGRLFLPTEGASDSADNSLKFCVYTKQGWRAASIPYSQITSLAYGFVPQGPVLSTNGTTVIGTAVTASTAVLAITSGINSTWKASLAGTGVGVAAGWGLASLYRAGFPLKRTRRKEWYYLVVGFNTNEVSGQREEAKKWDYSKTYYASKGNLAVFAMETESFWPTVLLLQSGTGVPLGSLPVPSQSAK